MGKKIILRLSIFLTLSALVYSMFWFFKISQIERSINEFVAANGANILISDVQVSGFPFTKKITVNNVKFTLPTPFLNKKQVVLKKVVLETEIASHEYNVIMNEAPRLTDIDGNYYDVSFKVMPKINVIVSNGRIDSLSYQDQGYEVRDDQSNVIYSASATKVNYFSDQDSSGKITAKLTSNVSDIQGFGVAEVYKNVFEKSVVEGIKTGEIVVGNNMPQQVSTPAVVAPAANPVVPVVADNSAPKEQVQVDTKASPAATANDDMAKKDSEDDSTEVAAKVPAMQDSVKSPETVPAVGEANKVVVATETQQIVMVAGQNSQSVTPKKQASVVPVQDMVPVIPADLKSNFTLEMNYVLTPVTADKGKENQEIMPQIQIVQNYQYNKTTNITNLEFSNDLYRVVISGKVTQAPDDELPSGSIAIKVDQVGKAIDHIRFAIDQIIDKISDKYAGNNVAEQAAADQIIVDNNAANVDAKLENMVANDVKSDATSVVPTASDTKNTNPAVNSEQKVEDVKPSTVADVVENSPVKPQEQVQNAQNQPTEKAAAPASNTAMAEKSSTTQSPVSQTTTVNSEKVKETDSMNNAASAVQNTPNNLAENAAQNQTQSAVVENTNNQPDQVVKAVVTTPELVQPQNPYVVFLQRVSDNIERVSQEIASKNQSSKDGNAQFEVKREKNLELLINDVSLREILGKM